MGKLLCLEIPNDGHAGMIFIRLDNNGNTYTDILVKGCDVKDFQFALENNKYITFDSIAYVKNIEPPTDEHGWLVELDNPGCWIDNVGFRVDLIRIYNYI